MKTTAEAAVLADEYVLTYRGDRGYNPAEGSVGRTSTRGEERQNVHSGKHEQLGNRIPPYSEKICNFVRVEDTGRLTVHGKVMAGSIPACVLCQNVPLLCLFPSTSSRKGSLISPLSCRMSTFHWLEVKARLQ